MGTAQLADVLRTMGGLHADNRDLFLLQELQVGIGDSEAVTETGFDLFARPPGWQDAAHRVSAIAVGENIVTPCVK